MRELSQIDQELRQIRQELDRVEKLDAMLADLERQDLQRRQAAAEAFGELNQAEEKAAFLASGRETEHESRKPRRDQKEVAQARGRYEQAEWDLQNLEDRLWEIKRERAGLEEQEKRYQALLKEKEQYLCCTGSSEVPRLVEIAKETATADRLIGEMEEALQTGEQAQARLREMDSALEQAKRLALDSANTVKVQACTQEAWSALDRLRTELSALNPKDVPRVDLEGFSDFADNFLEELFADLFELGGEKQAQVWVDNTLCEVDALIEGMKKELEQQKQTRHALQQEREALLNGTERGREP